jgi:hypothetical protein
MSHAAVSLRSPRPAEHSFALAGLIGRMMKVMGKYPDRRLLATPESITRPTGDVEKESKDEQQYPRANTTECTGEPRHAGSAPAHGAVVENLQIRLAALVCVALTLSVSMLAQAGGAPETLSGYIAGTVTDVNNDILSGATVVLQGPDPTDRRTVLTNESGFFRLQDVKPGVPYRLIISAKGFTDWTSPVVTLNPGEYKILNGKLEIQTVKTTVVVSPSTPEIATQQVQAELKQRVLGIFPNFYVTYEAHPAPLTPKLKFKLAFRVLIDPVTIAGIAAYSGIQQAADTPNFQQGAKGYFQRFGANSADGFTDVIIGGAILPSLLHQDPRYFYKGKGTKKSRILHALSYAVACKGDNGKWQPNYSSLGGDLASAAISNAYYPESNRGVGLVFRNVAIGAAERDVSSLLQEFVLARFTHKK